AEVQEQGEAKASVSATTALVATGGHAAVAPAPSEAVSWSMSTSLTPIVESMLEPVRQKTAKREQVADALRFGAEVVFSYWRERLGKRRAVFDGKRERRIIERLRENSGNVSELLWAVEG